MNESRRNDIRLTATPSTPKYEMFLVSQILLEQGDIVDLTTSTAHLRSIYMHYSTN
jgi:hypothetical protein